MIHFSSTSVKKALARVNVKNASFRQCREKVNQKLTALDREVGAALKSVQELTNNSIAHITGLEKSRFYGYMTRFVKKTR